MSADNPICANCGHSKAAHWDRYGCQIEGPDVWIEGINCGGLVASGPCGCKDFVAEQPEPTLCESMGRVQRALDKLTHLSDTSPTPAEERMEISYYDRRSGA